jgi:hypothetical protein
VKITVSWNVKPCCPEEVYGLFKGPYRLHLRDRAYTIPACGLAYFRF